MLLIKRLNRGIVLGQFNVILKTFLKKYVPNFVKLLYSNQFAPYT